VKPAFDVAPLLVQEGLGVVRCDDRQPPPDPLLNKGGGAVLFIFVASSRETSL
jgi:hypothetical protein